MVFSLFSSSAPRIVPPETQVINNGRRNGLVESLIQTVKANTQFWDKATVQQLRWMKSVTDKTHMDPKHDFVKKIDLALAKCAKTIQKHLQVPDKDPQLMESLRYKDRVLAARTNAPNASFAIPKGDKFSQNNLTIEQMKEIIEAQGDRFVELELNDADDQLLALIAAKCPNLTSLTIDSRLDTLFEHLTDAGLENIGKLSKLTKLGLNIWDAMHVTTDGLQKLLSLTQFQNTLKELTLITFQVNNDVLNILATYKQLGKLSISTTSITPVGTEALVQSANLKATLQSLNLVMGECWGTLVTNKVLIALSAYPNLKELKLSGKWEVTDTYLQSLLQAKTALTSLDLESVTITSAVASKIGALGNLVYLNLGDCSQLGEADYNTILSGKDNLKTLSFDNALYLTDDNIPTFCQLKSLSSLALLHCSYLYKGIDALCNAPTMQSQLSTLHVSHNKVIPCQSFSQINQLKVLTTLRIDSCPQFNDESLKALSYSSLQNTLNALELSGVSISDARLYDLSRFHNIQTLMMADCYAITQEGANQLLRNPLFQGHLLKLYLAGFTITADMIPLFNNYQKLEVLVVGNPNRLSYDREGEIFKQPNLKKMNTAIELFYGELTPFSVFDKTE